MSNETETPGAPESEPNLEVHPLVAKLGAQGQAPRDLATLVGYLGPASQDDQVRLYHDLSFRGYYDIPRSEVVHTEPLNAGDENSPTRVLVNASARVAQTHVSTQSGEARFLQGGITSGFLPTAAAPAAPIVVCGTVYTAAPTVCATGTVSILCYQTHFLGCTTATTPPQTLDCPRQAAAPIHPTLWTQIACPQTQLLGCTTVTATPPTTTHLMGCTTATTPPQQTHLDGCTTATTPPMNLAAFTTQGPCATRLFFCPPPTQPEAMAVTTTIHATTWTQLACTQLLGCTTATTPPQTNFPGCTTATTPPANLASPQAAFPNTLATVCTQFNCATHQFICFAPTQLPGNCTVPPVSLGCPQPTAQQAAPVHPTVWTQIACPTQQFVCIHPSQICTVPPPSIGCAQGVQQNTAATLCTQIHCFSQVGFCTVPPVSVGCPQGVQQNVAQNTAATVCTQFCTVPPHTVGCPVHQNTAATVCTQINCR
jgi:hypothetical protein